MSDKLDLILEKLNKIEKRLDQLEAQGFVGPAIGSKPREVLKK